jgi:small lipoprotein (TIGR04452 family)
MKKIIFSLVVLLFVSNCVVLDSLGLNLVKDTVKGSEAKNQILTSALMGAAASGSDLTFASSQATYNTKNLKDNKFYDKSDVDDCADRIAVANFASNTAATMRIAVGSYICSPINEHKTFIDWPISLF